MTQTSSNPCHKRVKFTCLALALILCGTAGQAIAAGPVKCVFIKERQFPEGLRFDISPPTTRSFSRSRNPSPVDHQWVTPGFELSLDSLEGRVMCYETAGVSSKTQIVLKIIPTAEYLQALKEDGLDVAIWGEGQVTVDEIGLLRDHVAPGIGRTVALPGVRSVMHPPPSHSIFAPRAESLEQDFPALNLKMQVRVVDMAKGNPPKLSARHPPPTGLVFKIMAADQENGAEILTSLNYTKLHEFSTCPPPTIQVANTMQDRAIIDFGVVALKELKSGIGAPHARPFMIELVEPRPALFCHLARLGKRIPKLRFTSEGHYRNGMFEGPQDDASHPGNSAVAIQLSDGSSPVRGGNRGDADASAFLPFPKANLKRTFVATLKYKPGAAVDRPGPFLIPVTLEAFYH